MNSITEIKAKILNRVKILNQGKNTNNLISLGAFAFFQNESRGHGRGLLKASLVSLIVKKVKRLETANKEEIARLYENKFSIPPA